MAINPVGKQIVSMPVSAESKQQLFKQDAENAGPGGNNGVVDSVEPARLPSKQAQVLFSELESSQTQPAPASPEELAGKNLEIYGRKLRALDEGGRLYINDGRTYRQISGAEAAAALQEGRQVTVVSCSGYEEYPTEDEKPVVLASSEGRAKAASANTRVYFTTYAVNDLADIALVGTKAGSAMGNLRSLPVDTDSAIVAWSDFHASRSSS